MIIEQNLNYTAVRNADIRKNIVHKTWSKIVGDLNMSELKICPRCGGVISYNSWFKGYMCNSCNIVTNSTTCDKCGDVYNTEPFANMDADGELTYSSFHIYGNKYNLCPTCTSKLDNWIRFNKSPN